MQAKDDTFDGSVPLLRMARDRATCRIDELPEPKLATTAGRWESLRGAGGEGLSKMEDGQSTSDQEQAGHHQKAADQFARRGIAWPKGTEADHHRTREHAHQTCRRNDQSRVLSLHPTLA